MRTIKTRTIVTYQVSAYACVRVAVNAGIGPVLGGQGVSVRKVNFGHYCMTIPWPPLVFFYVGRPFVGLLMSIAWVPWGFGLFIPTLGINWIMAVAANADARKIGPMLGLNIAAWYRLRLYERGVQILD